MRLTQHQCQAIVSATKSVFGNNAKVWLFGSRLDDFKHGGDIDLLLFSEQPIKDEISQIAKFKYQLYQSIGEQKIDTQMLTTPPTDFQQLMLENAELLPS